MTSVARLVQALEAVFLNGIVEECVVNIQDNVAKIKAMDMTSSVYTQTECPFEHPDGQIGLGNLSILIKYMKSYASGNMDIARNDNVLTFKPENGGTLKYLLSEVDLVPTYDSGWEEEGIDPIADTIAGEDCHVVITEAGVKEFLKLMGLFKPNSAVINVSKRGRVTLHGGNATDHQFNVTIGNVEVTAENPVGPIQIKLYGNNLTAVLSALDFTDPITLYFVNGEIVIAMENFAWVLRPLSAESGTDE